MNGGNLEKNLFINFRHMVILHNELACRVDNATTQLPLKNRSSDKQCVNTFL